MLSDDDREGAACDSAEQCGTPIRQRLSLRKKFLFALILFMPLLGLLEVAARFVDGFTEVSVEQLRDTYHHRRTARLGHFWPAQRNDYPYLPFTPNPHDPRVNEIGFRGEEVTLEKPDNTYRILCLGGSTTWDEYPALLQKELKPDFAARGLNLEVLNGGNVFYTSMESLINFATRGLPLKPDAIVVYHGINDGIPAFGETHSMDYSHWRGRLENLEPLFWDHLPVWLDHSYAYVGLRAAFERDIPMLGWNEMTMKYKVDFETSPYNGVEPYRQNIYSLICLARTRGVEVFLCTPVFNYHYEFHKSLERWGRAVEDCNEVTRSFAGRWNDVHVIDVAANLTGSNDWMVDMCHFSEQGKVRIAHFIASGIRPRLDRLIAKQSDVYHLATHMPPREHLASQVTGVPNTTTRTP